jgi:hypothetical protein
MNKDLKSLLIFWSRFDPSVVPPLADAGVVTTTLESTWSSTLVNPRAWAICVNLPTPPKIPLNKHCKLLFTWKKATNPLTILPPYRSSTPCHRSFLRCAIRVELNNPPHIRRLPLDVFHNLITNLICWTRRITSNQGRVSTTLSLSWIILLHQYRQHDDGNTKPALS